MSGERERRLGGGRGAKGGGEGLEVGARGKLEVGLESLFEVEIKAKGAGAVTQGETGLHAGEGGIFAPGVGGEKAAAVVERGARLASG